MEIKTKYMSRSSWTRIIEREYSIIDVEKNNLKGKIGLLHMKNVREPLTKVYGNNQITIVDNGYYWLQIGLENKNYWITAMYDNNEKLIQYYIDITKENHVNNDNPCFDDLFIDVVILSNTENFQLDLDELKQAFDEKVITKEEYDLAINQANYILNLILNNREEFDSFCYKYFNLCKSKFNNDSKFDLNQSEHIKRKSI